MAQDTRLEKSIKQLETVLAERYETQSAIKREGNRIIIPEAMTWRDAAEAILSHEKKMEEVIQTRCDFDCHPHDGLVAFYHAIKKEFGELLGAESYGFFGKIPGRSYTVPTGWNTSEVVPIGEAEIPGCPVKMDISPIFNDDKNSDVNGGLVVVFTYKRKYDALIKEIERLTKEEIASHSIFRGKAIDSKFNFLNVDNFDSSRVVYAKSEKLQLEANLLSPISNSQAWKDSGSRLRRGILLYGEYGTGKTLTALLAGKHCVENGWTFVNVLPGDDIVRALRFAKRYQPACVFFEDIDNDTSGIRDDRINSILNTIDGLLSKDSELITVLTTNHIENISRGMLRPGRLDSIIRMGILDSDAVVKLIKVIGHTNDGTNLIEGELNQEEIWEAAKDYVPAFVVEAVTKAKAYGLARNKGTKLTINNEDIVSALNELRPQFDMMRSDQMVRPAEINVAVQSLVTDVFKEQMNPYMDLMDKLEKKLR